jgi:putative ABC transport system permease protein
MRRVWRRLRYLIAHDRLAAELAEELQQHREMTERQLEATGLPPDEAAAVSHRILGNQALVIDQSRDVWVWPWLQDISQDVRFAARMLAKDRRFTLAAVVALGLGIGVNNSVFAIINATLIREVPFERADRLLALRTVDGRGQEAGVSLSDFRDWQASTRTFEDLAATTETAMNVSDHAGPAERLRGAYVSGNVFRLLRVAPILGRDLRAEEDRPGAEPVVLIGHGLWVDRYGSDPTVISRTITINNVPATIVGVMPPGFRFPFMAQLWQPLTHAPNLAAGEPRRDARTLSVTGRLADSSSRTQAQADLDTIAARLAADHPATNKGVKVRVAGMKESVRRTSRPMLLTMMGAVAFVMLIACANLANLLLARSASRSREIAIRASLGAARWRIVRQLLIECALLAAMAGVLGLVLSVYGIREIARAFSPLEVGAPITSATTPYWLDVSMNGYVYSFVGALCLFATLAFGLIPALHVSRTTAHETLKEGGRTLGGARARRWSSALMVSELALTLVLLAATGLLWRSFITLYTADTVLNPTGVVMMEFALPIQKYATPEQRRLFLARLDERLRAIPAASSVAVSSHSPVQSGAPRPIVVDGQHIVGEPTETTATTTYVTPAYFETLGLRVLEGRALVPSDGRPGEEGVVVNQRLADMFFPQQSAIGQRIQLGTRASASSSPWLTIVGVVPTLQRYLGPRQQQLPDPAVYVPIQLDPAPRAASIIVQAGSAGVAVVAPLLRAEMRALDPDLPLYNLTTLEDAIALSRYPVRLVGTWFAILAVIALVVAAVGLFALTAHGVAQRTQEIGVRIALGARTAQIVWMFLRRTLLQLTIGLVLGLAGALSIGQLLQGYLRQVSPRDPFAIGLVALLLTVVAAVATLLPARRAARIDPAVALRAE